MSLSKSVAVMGSGIGKILEGVGLKPESGKGDEEAHEAKKKETAANLESAPKEPKKDETAANLESASEEAKKKEAATNLETASKDSDQKKKTAEKQKRLAVILGLPDFVIDASKVLSGVSEVLSGGKDTAFLLGHMVCALPGLFRKKASCLQFRYGSSMTSVPSMGTGYCGLRMALNRQIVTRSCGGKLQVYDGFGARKSKVPQNLCGTRLIGTEVELAQADFRTGNLKQWLDVDIKRTSLDAARAMWRTLCNEELTGLVVQDCPLAVMALQAGALLEEKKAVEGQLLAAEAVGDELSSCVAILDEKLSACHEVTTKDKQD